MTTATSTPNYYVKRTSTFLLRRSSGILSDIENTNIEYVILKA